MKNVLLPNMRLFALFPTAVALACSMGCSSIDPQRMVPRFEASAPLSTKSIQVMEVTGGQKSKFNGPATIEGHHLRGALISALQDAKLFREVSSTTADLALHASIKSQNQRVKGMVPMEYTANLVVTYKIADPAGKVIWTESYESEASSVAFSGATRTVRAHEGSVKENIASAIAGMRAALPQL
jgi:hypothetical protein